MDMSRKQNTGPDTIREETTRGRHGDGTLLGTTRLTTHGMTHGIGTHGTTTLGTMAHGVTAGMTPGIMAATGGEVIIPVGITGLTTIITADLQDALIMADPVRRTTDV